MPTQKRYVCLRCQRKFELTVWDREEAQQEEINLEPIKCPSCQTTDIMDEDKIAG